MKVGDLFRITTNVVWYGVRNGKSEDHITYIAGTIFMVDNMSPNYLKSISPIKDPGLKIPNVGFADSSTFKKL